MIGLNTMSVAVWTAMDERGLPVNRQYDEERVSGRSLSEIRGEEMREFWREKCASGVVFPRSEAMKQLTLSELSKAIADLVPEEVTTTVEVSVMRGKWRETPDVTLRVFATQVAGGCEMVAAATAAEALDKFKAVILPRLGLTEPGDAEQRLEELRVTL